MKVFDVAEAEIEIQVLQKMVRLEKANDQRKQRKDKGLKRIQYAKVLDTKYMTYKKRAAKKGFEFELTEEMFLNLSGVACKYCGSQANCFDRNNPKIGYTVENSIPACSLCNMMKYTLTSDGFLKQVVRIARFSTNTDS